METPIEPRPALTRIDPNKKVSDEDWNLIRELYCAGANANDLAARFGIKPCTIHKKASVNKWVTPMKLAIAAKRGVPTDDPAGAVAELWKQRQGEARESIYQGSKKALDRFFAMAPVPASFAEAAIAEKMLNKAIDPTEGKTVQQNVNLSLLTSNDFSPRPIDV